MLMRNWGQQRSRRHPNGFGGRLLHWNKPDANPWVISPSVTRTFTFLARIFRAAGAESGQTVAEQAARWTGAFPFLRKSGGKLKRELDDYSVAKARSSPASGRRRLGGRGRPTHPERFWGFFMANPLHGWRERVQKAWPAAACKAFACFPPCIVTR